MHKWVTVLSLFLAVAFTAISFAHAIGEVSADSFHENSIKKAKDQHQTTVFHDSCEMACANGEKSMALYL